MSRRGRRRRAGSAVDGVLVLDKPAGPTSHDLVAETRLALDTPAVGHAGTLDPMATGVLVLGVGEGTKLVPYLTAEDKVYEATLQLGASTTTLDAEGAVTDRRPLPEALDRRAVEAVASRFLGPHLQRAPAVSAIKRAGVPLHERVRRGEQVEAPLREVRLDAVEVLGVDSTEGRIALRLSCGKGFYVRSFGRDLAEGLGTVGHLVALRRTRSGAFAADATTTEATRVITEAARRLRHREELPPEERSALRRRAREQLWPLGAAWRGRPMAWVDDPGARDVRHGRPVAPDRILRAEPVSLPAEDAPIALLDAEGRLLAIAAPRPDGGLRVLRGFSPSPEPPPSPTGAPPSPQDG